MSQIALTNTSCQHSPESHSNLPNLQDGQLANGVKVSFSLSRPSTHLNLSSSSSFDSPVRKAVSLASVVVCGKSSDTHWAKEHNSNRSYVEKSLKSCEKGLSDSNRKIAPLREERKRGKSSSEASDQSKREPRVSKRRCLEDLDRHHSSETSCRKIESDTNASTEHRKATEGIQERHKKVAELGKNYFLQNKELLDSYAEQAKQDRRKNRSLEMHLEQSQKEVQTLEKRLKRSDAVVESLKKDQEERINIQSEKKRYEELFEKLEVQASQLKERESKLIERELQLEEAEKRLAEGQQEVNAKKAQIAELLLQVNQIQFN